MAQIINLENTINNLNNDSTTQLNFNEQPTSNDQLSNDRNSIGRVFQFRINNYKNLDNTYQIGNLPPSQLFSSLDSNN